MCFSVNIDRCHILLRFAHVKEYVQAKENVFIVALLDMFIMILVMVFALRK